MQSTQNNDVLIIGAGAAGLIAWRELCSLGLDVVVLEARDRIGGRILTDHSTSSPIELGAEFVHGKPKDLWPILEKAGLAIVENSDTQGAYGTVHAALSSGISAARKVWKALRRS